MARDSPNIEFVEGQPVTPRRGIAWLRMPSNAKIDAEAVFNELPENKKDYLQVSMGAWIDNKPDIPKRFHGWLTEPDHKDCYVFKWRDNKVRHRIYGFKTRPGLPDGRFEICILAMYATKNTATTDPFYKKMMNRLRDDVLVKAAILKRVKEQFSPE